MKKLKIYLDTSVISDLYAPDMPEREADTKRLWDDIKAGKYDVVFSDLMLIEVNKCAEPKRSFIQDCISNVHYEEAFTSAESRRLSSLYLERGGLPPKSRDDALHIAIATVSNCDILLSWNFRHIVNLRAMTAVEAVNIQECFRTPRILPPISLLEKEE